MSEREDGPAQIHPSAVVDPGAVVGAASRVWHFCHLMAGARVGRGCVLGQNVFVGGAATIGDGCKIQNNVSVYDGVHLADDVFVGPSAVFTNVRTPRAHVSRAGSFVETRVGRGASIGANATVVCGVAIGAWAMVGAGAVVTRDVAPHRLVVGTPARPIGWVCRCGERLDATESSVPASTPASTPADRDSEPAEAISCGRCGDRYQLRQAGLHRLAGPAPEDVP